MSEFVGYGFKWSHIVVQHYPKLCQELHPPIQCNIPAQSHYLLLVSDCLHVILSSLKCKKYHHFWYIQPWYQYIFTVVQTVNVCLFFYLYPHKTKFNNMAEWWLSDPQRFLPCQWQNSAGVVVTSCDSALMIFL